MILTWRDGPWADLVPFAFVAVQFVVFSFGFLIGAR